MIRADPPSAMRLLKARAAPVGAATDVSDFAAVLARAGKPGPHPTSPRGGGQFRVAYPAGQSASRLATGAQGASERDRADAAAEGLVGNYGQPLVSRRTRREDDQPLDPAPAPPLPLNRLPHATLTPASASAIDRRGREAAVAQLSDKSTIHAFATTPTTHASPKPTPELRVANTAAGSLVCEIIVRRTSDGALQLVVRPGSSTVAPRLRANVAKLEREMARQTTRRVSVRIVEDGDEAS